jgi:hypothetical protein
MKGAYFEVLSDLLTSVGAIAASVVMLTTGWYYTDAVRRTLSETPGVHGVHGARDHPGRAAGLGAPRGTRVNGRKPAAALASINAD